MKNFGKAMILTAAMTAMAGLSSAATIPVGATASYGAPAFGSATGITYVSLANIGSNLSTTVTPGVTFLNFFATGSLCFNPGAGTCVGGPDVAASNITNPIIGGFTASAGGTPTFLATSLPQFNSGPGGTNDWNVDFSNDFIVTSAGTGNVLVPNGAAFVVFVFRDSYYNDNVDNSPVDFGVNVQASNPVPEPATYGMMLAGLGALAAFRRYRRS